MTKENWLYYGDNLEILRRHIRDDAIDLIYLDPPFNSNQSYNVLFAEANGTQAQAQIKAFEDTWHWGGEAESAYQEVALAGDDVSQVMTAFRSFLGENDMMAYLAMLAPRLKELHRVLKPTGSIFFHCDQTASHYIKLLLDSIFDYGNFKNEIIWHYRRWTAAANRFQKMHDTIFWYSKSDTYTFNKIYIESTEGQKRKHERGWDRNSVMIAGKRRPQLIVYNKEAVDEAVKVGKIDLQDYARVVEVQSNETIAPDVWEIDYINSQAKERLGYPTQKPEALLKRIITACSNEGDLVLDPFCGCGTTIAVAQRLKRKWIGIDITHLAIALMKNRLQTAFGNQVQYKVTGEPVSLSGAKELAARDPYQFQWWSLGLVGARPVEQKKGADKGIDGRLLFIENPKEAQPKQIIFSVKAGGLTSSYVRDLRGVVEREKAAIGVLISLNEPTRDMIKEAASAGFYSFSGVKAENYSKIQLLTIAELLGGKKVACPPFINAGGNITIKPAPKAKPVDKIRQSQLKPD